LGETFIINRLDLKKMLTMLKVSDKNIDELESNLNRLHRHVDAVAFVGMLQKLGLKQGDITNILRRIGIDDISITDILTAIDEEKISATFGKVVVLNVE
jgi:hypothetical protein